MTASEQALNARLDHAYTEEQQARGDERIMLLLLRLREQELEDARSDLQAMRRVMLEWLATS